MTAKWKIKMPWIFPIQQLSYPAYFCQFIRTIFNFKECRTHTELLFCALQWRMNESRYVHFFHMTAQLAQDTGESIPLLQHQQQSSICKSDEWEMKCRWKNKNAVALFTRRPGGFCKVAAFFDVRPVTLMAYAAAVSTSTMHTWAFTLSSKAHEVMHTPNMLKLHFLSYARSFLKHYFAIELKMHMKNAFQFIFSTLYALLLNIQLTHSVLKCFPM